MAAEAFARLSPLQRVEWIEEALRMFASLPLALRRRLMEARARGV